MENIAGSMQDGSGARVVLADDHALFRNGLRDLLSEHGIDVVGEAADGPSAVALVERAAPDVVLMDLSMPGMSGIEATAQTDLVVVARGDEVAGVRRRSDSGR